MEELIVNNRPAVRINAEKIRETINGVLLNCNGEKKWFPKTAIKYEPEHKTVLIQEWLYKMKFSNG